MEESAIFDECVTDIKSGDSSLEFMLCDCSGKNALQSVTSILQGTCDDNWIFLFQGSKTMRV